MFVPLKSLDSLRPDPSAFRARVWDGEAENFVYPEREAGIVRSSEPTGVAFSGGGNRAMVAAWGQLRALVESGLIRRRRLSFGGFGRILGIHGLYLLLQRRFERTPRFLGETLGPRRLRASALESNLADVVRRSRD